ncbi:hypothetical protein HPB49_002255 [Dermacentor silvarum]|uniref:Uncharacterized protein n=1 Tax=Dermacentor silvarum TaxID=543639 RepID=A0ACB8C153_DERSI|nr:hypothetical protein HPB49_002255 [Dermacentor silvarum]
MSFSISVGHVKMSADELAENVKATETALLGCIGKRWETINALSLKSTMGPAFKLLADVVQESEEESTTSATEPEPEPELPTPPNSALLQRIGEEELYECVNAVLGAAAKKRRRFLEMVDLLVLLKDYDFKKYKRLKGVIKLPHVVKPTFRGCMIGYNADRKEARACNLDFISVDEVMQLKGRPTAIKKLAARYDAFFAPKDYYLLRDLNKLLEQNFKKERKCITPVPLYMELDVKELSFGISVGHVKMSADELAENVTVTVNEVLKRLKKGWENVRGLSVKSSMGPICKLY